MHCLMIGCGNMGSSLLRRWIDLDWVKVTVVDPTSSFADPRIVMLRNRQALKNTQFDLIIVAVKPQLIDKILPDYLPHLRNTGTVLSIAAGYSCDRLQVLTESRPIVRIMPNMPASLGQGTSGLYATELVSSESLDNILQMMVPTGEVITVQSEDELDKVTAIAGSGPGYVFEIARAYSDAAVKLGFDATTARRLALSTLAGTVAMALETGHDLADLRNSVTSKAGTTEAGLNKLNGDGALSRLFEDTTRAAYDRAVELR